MYDTKGVTLKIWKRELDLLFQKTILPIINQLGTFAESGSISNKKIKQIIIDLSSLIQQFGTPVINRYRSSYQDVSEFWIVGFVRDREGLESSITITKIEGKRPVLSVILLPVKSIAYSVIGSERGHQFDLNEISILEKKYSDKHTIIKETMDDVSNLRPLKINRTSNIKSEMYEKNIIHNYKGAVSLVRMEIPPSLIGIVDKRLDIFIHLKPAWSWEFAAFDHLIHSCGYMLTRIDGIMPIEYVSNKHRIAGFIAKNNFEHDTSIFNMD